MNTNEFIQSENEKVIIPVPAGIRYMNEWTDFSLDFFGNIPYIIDKQIPGCGFTEYCLTNNDNIVLTSPRIILLKNKEDQHPNDVYYARNDCEDNLTVDNDLNKANKVKDTDELTPEELKEIKKKNHEELTRMERELIAYCNRRAVERKPLKIIVTYDSFKHVKRFLINNGLLPHFKIVIDEFQSVFVDSRFKASTEFSFLEELRSLSINIPICFVSATPMMDKYLKQLDYFCQLPYFELDWGLKDPGRVMKPELKVRKIKSINTEIKRIIGEYKSGKFAVLANPVTGELIQSREAVFYVNSVNTILNIIKSEGLAPDEVNILCANTTVNLKRLKKKIGIKYKIGEVPLKGQPHKMFTFCTRTVYLGADFYSTNARTFVLSDANIDSLAVDISLDLPQILGRQRLIENPWKNHAEFYFKNLGGNKEVTQKDFDNRVKEKMQRTLTKIEIFGKADYKEKDVLFQDFRRIIDIDSYKNDYVSITYVNELPSVSTNKLVLIAEQRAFDIQQIDYKDRFTVFNIIRNSIGFKLDRITEFISHMRDTSILLPIRLKELCETEEFTDDEKKLIAQQTSEKFDKFYNIIGPKRCKALSYKTDRLTIEIQNLLISKDNLKEKFLDVFKVGDRYTNKSIKEAVRLIYEEFGLKKSPKATDINEYFETSAINVLMPDKTYVHGLKILSVKE